MIKEYINIEFYDLYILKNFYLFVRTEYLTIYNL